MGSVEQARSTTHNDPVEIAKEIDSIKREVGPLIVGRTPLGSAMAMMLLAAHTIFHDRGTENDFLEIAKSAWLRSKRIHESSCNV